MVQNSGNMASQYSSSYHLVVQNSGNMADKFEALEQQLELFIENTRKMGIIVSDFQPQGQNVLNQKM